jgi:cytochrome c oxidase cbb3-type subunit III
VRAFHHFRAIAFSAAIALVIVIVVAGCGAPHGQPRADSEVLAPNQITDFATLYSDNCSACHGAEGKGGAAIALANPVYLAIADDATIRKVAAKGISGTAMPAFAQSAGGMLTDAQLDIITQGIRSRWSKPDALNGASAPPYATKSPGDAQRGETAYKTFCESCHGPGGRGAQKGSAITGGSFLALITDQSLRTIVIAGRPEIAMPDWRGNVPGKPTSDQEITDVVAWLASKRVQNPGQPYPAANTAPASNNTQPQESDIAKRK